MSKETKKTRAENILLPYQFFLLFSFVFSSLLRHIHVQSVSFPSSFSNPTNTCQSRISLFASVCVSNASLNYQSEYIVLLLWLLQRRLSRDPNERRKKKERRKQRTEWTLTGKSVSEKRKLRQTITIVDSVLSFSLEKFLFLCARVCQR